MIYIVGSGLAGVSCAYPLAKHGLQVTMLDVGIDLEPPRQERVAALANSRPEYWDPEIINSLKNVSPSLRGIPHKLSYGSDYAFRSAAQHIIGKIEGVGGSPSFAKGGLSSVWGAGLMPYLASDLCDWPLPPQALDAHYAGVLEFTPLAAAQDSLADLFPLHTSVFQSLQPSSQALALLEHWKSRQDELQRHGYVAGRSRLAVWAERAATHSECIYCGLCLYGCPYRLIYNSAYTVDTLQDLRNFAYMNNVVVRRVVESGEEVRIEAYTFDDHQELSFDAERVFVACGTIPTTRIMLESMGAFDQPVRMLDSRRFLLPMLMRRAAGRARAEGLHTLAQIFIEVFAEEISKHPVHLSLYTYNDLYLTLLQNILGPLLPILLPAADHLLDRLITVQGFLHSDLCGGALLTLRHVGDQASLEVKAEADMHVRRTVRKVVERLARHRHLLGLTPVFPLLMIDSPGAGYHIGGTFPMAERPGPFQTDTLGRLPGYKRVHLVDASTFPSIPATTISFATMANARRIATKVIEQMGNGL